MCKSIWVTDDGKRIGTVRELATWLDVQPLELIATPLHEPLIDMPAGWEDACLCPIDISETLDEFKVWHRRDVDGDSMRYLATKVNP